MYSISAEMMFFQYDTSDLITNSLLTLALAFYHTTQSMVLLALKYIRYRIKKTVELIDNYII